MPQKPFSPGQTCAASCLPSLRPPKELKSKNSLLNGGTQDSLKWRYTVPSELTAQFSKVFFKSAVPYLHLIMEVPDGMSDVIQIYGACRNVRGHRRTMARSLMAFEVAGYPKCVLYNLS